MRTVDFTILAFGIAKDIIGGSQLVLPSQGIKTVGELKAHMLTKYPAFGKLNSLAFAVNNEYAKDELAIDPMDEIVLIPPVSGG
ncbi:MAG: MoaD/ThiS family protein [Bacteroidota bacterium]